MDSNFKIYVCNGCHDLKILSVNISNTTITTFKNADYCCILYNISIFAKIDLLKSSPLEKRGYMYKKILL